MNSQTLGLRTASVIFAVNSVVLLGRLVTRIELHVGGHRVGIWPSLILAGAYAVLSIWMARLAGKSRSETTAAAGAADVKLPPAKPIGIA